MLLTYALICAIVAAVFVAGELLAHRFRVRVIRLGSDLIHDDHVPEDVKAQVQSMMDNCENRLFPLLLPIALCMSIARLIAGKKSDTADCEQCPATTRKTLRCLLAFTFAIICANPFVGLISIALFTVMVAIVAIKSRCGPVQVAVAKSEFRTFSDLLLARRKVDAFRTI